MSHDLRMRAESPADAAMIDGGAIDDGDQSGHLSDAEHGKSFKSTPVKQGKLSVMGLVAVS